MSCPINTTLANGSAFESLSERDKEVAITQLLVTKTGGDGTQQGSFQALAEREQWLCIAILLNEYSNSLASPGAVVDSNPNTLLANAADFQGASEAEGNSAIAQKACDL